MQQSTYDKKNLLYRRQFILSRKPIVELDYWKIITIDEGFYLYIHPDLNVSLAEQGSRKLILIGYILDYQDSTKDDQNIVNEIINNANSFDSLIQIIKKFAGQYIFIYKDIEQFILFHDPIGLREVYYCQVPNKIICASQPNLIIKFADPEIFPTNDPMKIRFYKEEMPRVRKGRLWVGDETIYDEIRHLLPNHCLDVNKLIAFRYWPNEKIKKRELSEAVELAGHFLTGILKSALSRYELMMAVTAGNDTRTLLAASRNFRDRIYYFINKYPHMDDNHPDIRIPKAIFGKLNIPFHIHVVKAAVPDSFKEIFFNNVFFASEQYLPVIYHIYYKQHSSKVNVLGVGEIGRRFYGKPPKRISGYFLARALKYKNSLYAVEQLQKWYEEVKPLSDKFNVDIMTLLLWEQLLGNWGVVADSEADIAIEYLDPFNSHYLYEVLLGVDSRYSSRKLFTEIIRTLWPALLEFPINPPETFYDRLRAFLSRINMFDPLRNIIYKIDEIKFKKRLR